MGVDTFYCVIEIMSPRRHWETVCRCDDRYEKPVNKPKKKRKKYTDYKYFYFSN